MEERACKVFNTTRSASAGLASDGAFDHLHMAITPLLQSFVDIYQPLAEHRNLWIASMYCNELTLKFGVWLIWHSKVTLQ